MALILSIETATSSCSIALSKDGLLIYAEGSSVKNTHSSVVTQLIENVVAKAGKELQDIDAFAVGEGPGSYTGLRIGVATAKGLCDALDKPLIAISTLQSLSVGMRKKFNSLTEPEKINYPGSDSKRVLFCPMLDARRMEVYCAIYDNSGNEVMKPAAEIVTENSFSTYFENNFLVFGGDGYMKCKAILEQHSNVFFLDEMQASATFMAALAEEKFSRKEFEELAYFEPFYLKDFVAGKPRVKGLR